MAPLESISPITSPIPTPPPNDLATDVFDHSEPPPLQVGDWGGMTNLLQTARTRNLRILDSGVADPSPRVTLPMAERVGPKGKLSLY